MVRDWLAEQLAAGRSIESIAREVGRNPSTLSYWVRKFGLRSQHEQRHAARGGIEREALEVLVAGGLSTRQIAEALGRSQGTVRHWLARYELRTERVRRGAGAHVVAAPGATERTGVCARHGEARFGRRPGGGWRCLKCRAEHVAARRRRVKALLLEDAGGACVLCGYDRAPAALQFHHVDPATKEFHIAHRGVTRSLERARAEAAKCILLCANCHAEVEAGIATLPASTPGKHPG